MAEKNSYLTGDQLQVGMRVLHDRFGQGTVVGSTGEVGQEIFGVHFEGEAGPRILDIRFAKLLPVQE